MKLALALLATLLLVSPVTATDSDDLADAIAEQEARSEELRPLLEQWTYPLKSETLQDIEALTTTSLDWLDSLEPADCWAGWWAAIRTSWELTAMAVRLQRAGYPGTVIGDVFKGVGMTRGVGAELADGACS